MKTSLKETIKERKINRKKKVERGGGDKKKKRRERKRHRISLQKSFRRFCKVEHFEDFFEETYKIKEGEK